MITSYGQTPEYQIKGQLEDSFSYSIPYNANIIVLKNKDTIAQSNSDKDGRFQLSVFRQLQIIDRSSQLSFI